MLYTFVIPKVSLLSDVTQLVYVTYTYKHEPVQLTTPSCDRTTILPSFLLFLKLKRNKALLYNIINAELRREK